MGMLRRLFGPKKPSPAAASPSSKEKKRWSFVRSSKSDNSSGGGGSKKRDAFSASFDDAALDANKHAIAVATATAAVAEAALAAAHAAAEVVRLTGWSGRSAASSSAAVNRMTVDALAAVRIQSAFRGYLARRALRALKALVKLQALVRGHVVRKQTADMLRRMQTLARVQARARASRTLPSESSHSGRRSSHSHHARNLTDRGEKGKWGLEGLHSLFDHFKFPHLQRCGSNSTFGDISDLEKPRIGSNRLDGWVEECLWSSHGSSVMRNRHADDDTSDKILEVDTWEPNEQTLRSGRVLQISHQSLALDHLNQSFTAFESPSKLSTRLPSKTPSFFPGEDDAVYRTAANSPHVHSASSRPGSSNGRGPFTPTRSECSWGFFNGYPGYPSYMANTESSRAKFRSQSAPRQRSELERYGSNKLSLQRSYDAEIFSETNFGRSNEFRRKAYPPSSRLNRVGSTIVR